LRLANAKEAIGTQEPGDPMNEQHRVRASWLASALFLQFAGCAVATDEAGPDLGGAGHAGSASSPSGSGGANGGTGGAGSGETGGSSSSGGSSGVAGSDVGAGGRGGTSGSGGQAGGGAGNFRPDGGAPRDGGGPVTSDSGPPSNPALDAVCTPKIVFNNMFPNTTGGMRFNTAMPDVTSAMQAHSQTICRWIYRKPEEVRKVTTLTVNIDNSDGVAFTSGSTINFSSTYIGGIGGNAAAISFEINGVLVHEGTHVWQYDNGGGSLVEAMADYVRYRSGFDKLSRRHTGGNWSDPYTTGGFFIAWVEDKYDKDWGYKINMGMKTPGFSYPNFIQQTFGKSADALWAEYQADIK
jgi:hypothetical protein